MISKRPSKNHQLCTSDKENLSINLSNCTRLCRYHKYPRRKSYNNRLLAPKGMCIDLFHSAYPHCLSLLYDATYPKKVIVTCPNPDANVSIEIKKKLTKTRYLRRFLVWLLAKFGYEIEFPDKDITMTVRNKEKSKCLYSHKKGQSFQFNIWLGRELCPATFDALYPSIHNLMRGGCIPWHQEKNDGNKIVCPDPKSNITMSISKKKL